jgi:hypothetical protein
MPKSRQRLAKARASATERIMAMEKVPARISVITEITMAGTNSIKRIGTSDTDNEKRPQNCGLFCFKMKKKY